jgi:predicted regulator of Ras-like GTPase activity (Roadblock/LC7/MglB family)
MKPLPEGKSLGWMQAPASWIDSHTVRFIGVVRVVIQDGEGFILIKKGKPLFHYFKQGTIELKGHTALDYFNSHPVIEFNLCKYTPDELAWAMKLCNIEDHDRVVPKVPVVSGPVSGEHNIPSLAADQPVTRPAGDTRIPVPVAVSPQVQTVDKRAVVSGPVSTEHKPPSHPADPPLTKPAGDTRIPVPVVVSPPVPMVNKRAVISGPVSTEHKPPSHPADPPLAKPAGGTRIPVPIVVQPPVPTVEEKVDEPQPVVNDDPEVTLLSQIRDLDGIVALAVFNDNRTVIMMGDADGEVLVTIARKMLETAKKMTPRLPWGPFVHMTIQIPAGNMIIAPYQDNYLCLLTTRTINIGHIRRILRDLLQKGAPQRGS